MHQGSRGFCTPRLSRLLGLYVAKETDPLDTPCWHPCNQHTFSISRSSFVQQWDWLTTQGDTLPWWIWPPKALRSPCQWPCASPCRSDAGTTWPAWSLAWSLRHAQWLPSERLACPRAFTQRYLCWHGGSRQARYWPSITPNSNSQFSHKIIAYKHQN
jgi:hypothetical protein